MKKLTGIEWLVIFTIILVVARLFVWPIWSRGMREREEAFFESMGVSYGFVQGGIFVGFFAYLVIRVLKERNKRKAIEQRKLKLSDELVATDEARKERIRYGVTPAAFIEFWWLAIIVLVIGMAGLFKLISWVASFMSGA